MNRIFSILLFVLTSTTAFANSNSDIQEPQSSIIESLHDGDSYSIEITSVGCFNGMRQTVVVSKEHGILKASYQETVKTLTNSDIEAFKTFEHQLKSLAIGGCTTVDTYVVRYANQVFTTSDGTCSWNGGKKLLKAIS